MIAAAKKAVQEVVEEQSAKSEDFKRVYASMEAYYRLVKPWTDISEAKYLAIR
jgi:TRAP-type mannitol/chloroaromatic compound transport system substrate-binding protein